ncbi:30S ribosomal protein S1 [compost metagenome]
MELGQLGSKELAEKLSTLEPEIIATQLGVGVPTLRDILDSLQRPGRDPREELPLPIFRTDVLKIEDLVPGMELQGTVRNVIDFGAFVDIGIKNDGLVHISQLSNGFVKHPMDVVSVGDNVTVWVLNVDLKKGRVGLTMRQPKESNS